MEDQRGWPAHAAFMNGLAAEGFVLLVGPPEGTRSILPIARAQSEEPIARAQSEEEVIPTPADQLGWFGLGHQGKSVCGLMVAASSRRQRSATAAGSASSVAKCVLATASSSNGQKRSAGCNSGA